MIAGKVPEEGYEMMPFIQGGSVPDAFQRLP